MQGSVVSHPGSSAPRTGRTPETWSAAVTIILDGECACRSFIRSDDVEFLLHPRMILALPIAGYATGRLHLRQDVVVLRLAEGAVHPIEQSTPVGGDRRDRRRDRRRARVCHARADGRCLMNERDPSKDRRRRRFTPADIRQIRHHAPQCGLACWARHYSVSTVAIWKIVHKKSYAWVEE